MKNTEGWVKRPEQTRSRCNGCTNQIRRLMSQTSENEESGRPKASFSLSLSLTDFAAALCEWGELGEPYLRYGAVYQTVITTKGAGNTSVNLLSRRQIFLR